MAAQVSLAVAVVAHVGRLGLSVLNIKPQVEASDSPHQLFIDNGFLGEWRNHRRALEWGWSQDVSHVVVLQDDAMPVDGFMDHVHEAARRRPEDVIGLYVGTGRPYAGAVLEAVQEAREKHASWLVSDGLIWGVGAVWPVPLIADFLQHRAHHNRKLPYDQRAYEWSVATGHRCYHTWPSLVDHADTPSVIKGRAHGLELVRRAHEVGVPDWNNDVEVHMLLADTLRP